MEDMMMMTTTIKKTNPENPRKTPSISSHSTTTSTCPTWKLYENPYYTSQQDQKNNKHQDSKNKKQIHHLHLPVSARKIAASFWDLTFIKPLIESELQTARAQILELKAELERERKARKKMESLNKKLAREVSDERKRREALERVCEDLARETSANKAEINRLKKDIETERQMLRVAEVLREERVQMKLSEAKHVMEEKLIELEATKLKSGSKNGQEESKSSVLTEKSTSNGDNVHNSTTAVQRKASSPETENHHIKRGIKGFVEFPKVVKAIGSKSNIRHSSNNKLECQKAQIKMLLKHKNQLQSSCPLTS